MSDDPIINGGKPIICTFIELVRSLEPLHQNDRAMLADLQDIWKMGAPTPGSIIRNPKGYDERKVQDGNAVQRIVFPTVLAKWIKDAANKRGIPLDWFQAYNVAMGRSNYEVPESISIQMTKGKKG